MTPIGEIFLVDDEEDILIAGKQTFELEGYSIRTFSSGREVLECLDPHWLGVVITDVRMPGMSGLVLLDKIREAAPEVPVVILTGHGDVPMAIKAMHAGAYDFLEKPAHPEYLLDVAKRALESRRLGLENRSLRNKLNPLTNMETRIIGNSGAAREMRRTLSSLSMIDVDVLLLGETGVGKELAARSLHDLGHRKEGRFIPLNCGAIPANLVESELFGHERGAFTSASGRRIGKIESAHGGTLFLDEIESMPLDIQVKLLRTIQERSIERVGGDREIPVDFRVIAASKTDLRKAAAQGTFREDLFYRLNVARVPIPPLRSREDDAILLLRHHMTRLSHRFKAKVPELDESVIKRLSGYRWPGNVRELKNVAQQLLLGLPMDLDDSGEAESTDMFLGLDEMVQNYEKKMILEILEKNQGRIEKTAKELQIPRKRLYLRMQKFGITRK